MFRYKNDPNVLAIQKYSKKKIFHLEDENIGEPKKEILKLDKTTALQKTMFLLKSLMKILIYLQYEHKQRD